MGSSVWNCTGFLSSFIILNQLQEMLTHPLQTIPFITSGHLRTKCCFTQRFICLTLHLGTGHYLWRVGIKFKRRGQRKCFIILQQGMAKCPDFFFILTSTSVFHPLKWDSPVNITHKHDSREIHFDPTPPSCNLDSIQTPSRSLFRLPIILITH